MMESEISVPDWCGCVNSMRYPGDRDDDWEDPDDAEFEEEDMHAHMIITRK
ncbi:MAG: hypothetical protein OEX77_12240 [Candidatus Bathyarchaeota archaeon]|nr:hypothetical protein [Candidatus Bathyarchaeota archaeon]